MTMTKHWNYPYIFKSTFWSCNFRVCTTILFFYFFLLITLNLYRGADVKGRLSCLHHFLCLAGIHWPTTNPGISVYWAVFGFYCNHTQTRIIYLTCFALCSSALKLLPKDGLNLKWRLGLICRMTSVDAALSGSWLDQTTPWWFKVKRVYIAKHIQHYFCFKYFNLVLFHFS